MPFTVIGLLAFLAFCLTIASAVTGRVPLWVAVLLLCIIALLTTSLRLGP